MGRRSRENAGFHCVGCHTVVLPLTNGSYRNHCPACLTSLHVDETPGDRASECFGVMDAVGVVRTRKGWQLVHRCRRCRVEKVNRIAEGCEQPDDIGAVVRLMSAGPVR